MAKKISCKNQEQLSKKTKKKNPTINLYNKSRTVIEMNLKEFTSGEC